MLRKSAFRMLVGIFGILTLAFTLCAQVPNSEIPDPQPAPLPWGGAGARPCAGPEGGILLCRPAPTVTAVRAGHLFDSKTGAMLTNQVVLLLGQRITEVGPASNVKIPAGAQVIDLGQATVLPGLIDAHTHMFNVRKPTTPTEAALLIAVQNA
jgi:hypothetical protein